MEKKSGKVAYVHERHRWAIDGIMDLATVLEDGVTGRGAQQVRGFEGVF